MDNKEVFSCFFIVLFFMTCSNKTKFNIEKDSVLNFNEAYYQEWVSGVRGGGSGLSIFFVLENFNAIKGKIQIEGIYFKNEYAKLKYHAPNKYQAFINSNENSEDEYFEGDAVKAVKNKKKDQAFPFNLDENEAIISYNFKSTIKYYKVILSKKENIDIPR